MLKEKLIEAVLPNPATFGTLFIETLGSEVGMESEEMRQTRERAEEQKQKRIFTIVCIFSSIAMLISVVVMILETSFLCILAFSIPLFSGPYLVYQQKEFVKFKSLRYRINELRLQVDELRIKGEMLTKTINGLEKELDRLQSINASFDSIVQSQSEDSIDVLNLVKENQGVLKRMEKQSNAQALQEIITVILSVDRDQNFLLNETELNMLILRLSNLPSIRVDKEMLRASLDSQTENKLSVFVKLGTRFLEKDAGEFGISNNPSTSFRV